jgi:hypothetical protein
MYQFADLVTDDLDEIIEDIKCRRSITNTTETRQQGLFTLDEEADLETPSAT